MRSCPDPTAGYAGRAAGGPAAGPPSGAVAGALRKDSRMPPVSAAPRYAYLGPEGTFTEQALRQATGGGDHAELVPVASVDAALEAVRAGDVDAAMVPIENSVEGGVSATLGALAQGDPLLVVGEQVVPVT